MKILSVVCKAYYGHPEAVEPMYLAFTEPLVRLGHEVEHFDHVATRAELGDAGCGARFVAAVRRGGYDAVLYQTGGQDWMERSAIADAARLSPILAWNSDDDWQWESYTRHVASRFTFMATTYPHIYDANRAEHPNLLLSQWGCLSRFGDSACPKDLGFSFAGQVYRARVPELRSLRERAGLRVFGLGAMRVNDTSIDFESLDTAERARRLQAERALSFEEINGVWNRTKVSYTPMGASRDPTLLQIKSRTFEMGLSGTLMLCQQSPNLERYYTPGVECVTFDGIEDCVERARFYLRNEAARQKIAAAYVRRTRAEHLWEHRFATLFRDAGLHGVK